MSPQTPPTASPLEDYLDLLQALAEHGIEYVVIGGCAVAAYARQVGETVFSNDLDLLVTQPALDRVLAEAASLGLVVEKVPEPRSVPVALLAWRRREINLLTASNGLPPADIEARSAREFESPASGRLPILVADPFDLLRNKLAVNRPKDLPHIEILRRFIVEEAVHAFQDETDPRARIAPAERLLAVFGTQTLDRELASRLIPLARMASDFRFLAHRVPAENRDQIVAEAPESLRPDIARIAGKRGES
jgi:hypothetical protein